MGIIHIECGQSIGSTDANIDTSSSGTNRRLNDGPPYVIYAHCPLMIEPESDPINLDGHIGLTVPKSNDITGIANLQDAEKKLLSGGEVYRCSRFDTRRCPLIANS